MGHQTIQMVQRYAHLAPDHYKEAVEALRPFGPQKGTHMAMNDNENGAKSLKNFAAGRSKLEHEQALAVCFANRCRLVHLVG